MAECRICFEDASLNELISPCLCDGTSRYVHILCLDQWRQTGGRAFIQCSECNFKYKLTYQFPVEDYTFTEITRRDTGRYGFGLVLFLISGFFIRNVEKTYHYPSLTILNLGLPFYNNAPDILDSDEIYSGSYYFGLNNFLISCWVYTIFFIYSFFKVKRIGLYWYHFKFNFFFRFFLSLHFIWIYWFFGHDSAPAFELYVTFESFLSLFNILFFFKVLEEHNKIILFLNTKKNKSIVLEPTAEDLV